MDKSSVLVAEALVREFLAKHALDATLKAFEKERPRSSQSITNRSTLRQMTGMEKMAARLKKKAPNDPSPSTLEMLTSYQLSKQASSEGTSSAAAPADTEPEAPPKPREGFGFSSSTSPTAVPPRRPSFEDEGFSAPRGASSGGFEPPSSKLRSKPADDMMMMEDVDDFDNDFARDTSLGSSGSTWMPPARSGVSRGAPTMPGASQLSPEDGRRVQDKLFGKLGPPDSWKQGFFFSTVAGLEYGFVQTQGGPCGILAAVQAQFLAALCDYDGSPVVAALNRSKKEDALVKGIAQSLWEAGKGLNAQVVTCDEASTASMSLPQMLRSCRTTYCRSQAKCEEAVRRALGQLQEPDGWGVVLFLFSLCLSAGLDAINKDMDDNTGNLMGQHGYCTQDLVNLIICGRAVSNVFDKDKKLDEMVLKGIPKRGKIGFLSLFDWYKYIEVGSFYREPECGIWVVCCESHFTCLFTDSYPSTKRVPFDLYFYDGLAQQTEVIRLSVSKSPSGGHTAKAGDTIGSRGAMEGDLIPPLEFVIETRWPGVQVNWNGVDPIL